MITAMDSQDPQSLVALAERILDAANYLEDSITRTPTSFDSYGASNKAGGLPDPQSLVALAERILDSATDLEDSISRTPTFFNDTLSNLPPDLEEIKQDLIDSTATLNALARGSGGANGRVHTTVNRMADELSLLTLYRHRIPQAVPFEGCISFGDIARNCNLNEAIITRILRYAMTIHLFHEPSQGMVAHTADSRLLVEDPTLFSFVGAALEDIRPAYLGVLEAAEKWPGSEEPNHSGWQVAHGTEKVIHEHLRETPKRLCRFGIMSKQIAKATGAAAIGDSLALSYPWSSFINGTVVDVGGGNGHISISLAAKFPRLDFIVQDLPGVWKGGAASLPTRLQHRVSFTSHDFFEEQPIPDAEVYLYSLITNNWSDKYVVKMFTQLIPVMKPDARLLIIDPLLPEFGTASSAELKQFRSDDIKMLALYNSRERSLNELKRLVQGVDERFCFNEVYKLDTSIYSILEFIWREPPTTYCSLHCGYPEDAGLQVIEPLLPKFGAASSAELEKVRSDSIDPTGLLPPVYRVAQLA